MSSATGAVIAGAIAVAASPYLARLTLSAPDKDMRDWWRGRPASRERLIWTAVIGAVLGGFGGAAAGVGALLPAFALYALVCAPLVVIDYEHHRLPNRLVVIFAAGALVLLSLTAVIHSAWHPWLRAVEGGAAVYALFFVIVFIKPGSFGWGDVKLGGVLGAYLGWFGWVYVYYGMFGGFVLGALVSVVMLLARRATMKTEIPFGPSLILGPLIVLAFHLVPSFG
jgi:leader peptidase (prepilin peptidase)/N-methyltransferase